MSGLEICTVVEIKFLDFKIFVELLQLFCEVKTLSIFQRFSSLSDDYGKYICKTTCGVRNFEGPDLDPRTILFGHKTAVSVIN